MLIDEKQPPPFNLGVTLLGIAGDLRDITHRLYNEGRIDVAGADDLLDRADHVDDLAWRHLR